MTALLLLLLVAELGGLGWFAQSQGSTDDYRFRVYTACTLVFLCFTVFLLGSHARDRRAREDLDQLQRRISDLEARARR